MDQTTARRLARELNASRAAIWVAVTRDHFNGEWEKTNEWGVACGPNWFDHDPREKAETR